MNFSRALEVSIGAAQEAGAILRADFHRPSGPRGKGDKADADLEAEGLIRQRLLLAFPEFGYLGEETGRAGPAGNRPIWLVDPNDGTRDYLLGRRGSSVSIGLVVEGRPVLGVVFSFNYPDGGGVLFAWAQACGPLRRNGQVIEASLSQGLTPHDTVLVSSGGDRDPEANLKCSFPARYRAVASIAHRLALVASGEGAAATALFAPQAWDYAAGQALLASAGGVLLDEAGQEVRYAEDGSSRTLRAFGGAREVAFELSRRPWEKGKGPKDRGTVRLSPGEAVSDSDLLSRAQGCFLGQVAGESFGELNFKILRSGKGLLEDREDTLAGQPLYSEMALILGRSLLAESGYRAERAVVDYREWLETKPPAADEEMAGDPPRPQDSSSSFLLRTTPLGILSYLMPAPRVADLARQDMHRVYPNSTLEEASACLALALAHAVRWGDALGAYEAALMWGRDAGAATREALSAARAAPPPKDGWGVLVCLQNAFFQLLHAPSLAEGVVGAAERGGDVRTNAALVGALLGAVHGREAIPAQWRRAVLSCRPHPLRTRRARPMSCWPTDILEIAERLLLLGSRV